MSDVSWKLGSLRNHKGVLVTLIIVFIIHLLAGVLIKVPAFKAKNPKISFPQPFVSYLGTTLPQATAIYNEKALLLDSEPLFLPTEWNFGFNPHTVHVQTIPAPLLTPYEPSFIFEKTKFFTLAQEDDAKLQSARDLLKTKYFDLFRTFGYAGPPQHPRVHHTPVALVTITNLNTGYKVYETELAAGTIPLDKETLWRPTDYYLEITPIDNLMQATQAHSSGYELIDKTINQYVTESIRALELPAGYYRIEFQPN